MINEVPLPLTRTCRFLSEFPLLSAVIVPIGVVSVFTRARMVPNVDGSRSHETSSGTVAFTSTESSGAVSDSADTHVQ